MSWAAEGVAALAAITIVLIAAVALRPSLTAERGGRILAFVAFFVLPILVTTLGVEAHLEKSKSTEFCLSCHVMEPYGKSLLRDDTDYLPAGHYQNNRVPRDRACYSCHTQYTMFGGVRSKLKGLKHVWVNYVAGPPETIELYEPYQNRECLHCHAGARSFADNEIHAEMLGEIQSGETSCLECHDLVHDVGSIGEAPLWEPPETAAAEPAGGGEGS